MAAQSTLTAQQRFAQRSAARARVRARNKRIVATLAVPLALASCMVTAPRARVAMVDSVVPHQNLVPATSFVAPAGAGVVAGRSLLAGVGERDRLRATLCLASAIYYEAATEPDEGQRAVAQVVLNRARHPAWPHSVCGVVYQGSNLPGCQFSFACDGAMARVPMVSAWLRALRVADRALAGDVYTAVGSATFYHTLRVAPAWRLRMVPVGVVGSQIFYRQPGDAPDAGSLPIRYAGGEPMPGPLPRTVSFADLAKLRATAASAPSTIGPSPAVIAPIAAATAPSTPRSAAVHATVPVRDDDRYVTGVLPDSGIRPEFRDSGKWIVTR